jgi:hypothetical protein
MSSSLGSTKHVLREIYLSIFVAFFRIGQRRWSSDMNRYKAAVGTSLFHGFLLMGVSAWVAYYFAGTRLPNIPSLTFCGVFVAFYALHCYVFIRRRYGIAFEHTFRSFERPRQIRLLAVARLLIAASWAFVLGSASFIVSHTSAHQ